MVLASELREVMALRLDQQVHNTLGVEAKASTATIGDTVCAKLSKVRIGCIWNQHFRPLESLEDAELEKHRLEFLYSEGRNFVFRRRGSCHAREQLGIKVPLFAASGELVSVDLKTGRYVERVRAQQRREV